MQSNFLKMENKMMELCSSKSTKRVRDTAEMQIN